MIHRDLVMDEYADLPILLRAEDVADLLRTSRKAVYAMAQRGALPGVTRVGRRLLINRDDVVKWLQERRAPSAKEIRP